MQEPQSLSALACSRCWLDACPPGEHKGWARARLLLSLTEACAVCHPALLLHAAASLPAWAGQGAHGTPWAGTQGAARRAAPGWTDQRQVRASKRWPVPCLSCRCGGGACGRRDMCINPCNGKRSSCSDGCRTAHPAKPGQCAVCSVNSESSGWRLLQATPLRGCLITACAAGPSTSQSCRHSASLQLKTWWPGCRAGTDSQCTL